MEQLVQTTRQKADNFYSLAQAALHKPEEDVVPYSVCQNSYFAVINYLGSFLLAKGREFDESATVKTLLHSCRDLNNKFNDLHLAPMYDPEKTEDVWMNLDAAKDFLKMAGHTKDVVSSES